MSKFWWFATIVVSTGAVFQVLGHRELSVPTATPLRRVPVATAVAVRKKSPFSIEVLGNVTTIASVAIRPRIDDEIVGVHFVDGSEGKKGDLLITLDTRALEGQLQQAEATLARDKAQLEGSWVARRSLSSGRPKAGPGGGRRHECLFPFERNQL
jgi:multidrug efflux pump subunit AcrA (membrane-fusion protein)